MLMVLRLMDAEILPPVEGNALLAAIQALEQPSEEAAAAGETANGEPVRQADETLVRTEQFDASAREQTPESADLVPRDAARPH
jgi:hypothetical protein